MKKIMSIVKHLGTGTGDPVKMRLLKIQNFWCPEHNPDLSQNFITFFSLVSAYQLKAF